VTTQPFDSDALGEAMRAYQSGDATAFHRLYAALGPVVRRYLRSVARDDARVDDLVQETFLQLHRARRTYNPERPVIPWALAIARHVFLMECRVRKRKYDPAAVEFDEHVVVAEAGVGRGPDDAILARDALRRSLASLTPGTRRVVLMHHVQGWSFREIGERLGIKSAAAKLRASRGMNALRSRVSRARPKPTGEGGLVAPKPTGEGGRRHEDDEQQ
jgi:RNA polymerase sigma-70 factor (ECF subfamily)